jgi:uncharacterized repeat protein (TIGR04138 family)
MQAVNFEEIVEKIVRNDPRYSSGAYQFLREALDHTQKVITKPVKVSGRHVSGQELLEGIREYGLSQFGPMTMSVFAEWGIHRCEDFGELVFNLVENELLRKTETDSRDDFKSGYDFYQAFRKPFLPVTKQPWPTPESDLR